MADYDYLQEILKTVRNEGDKYGGEANLLAGIIKGFRRANEIMYQSSEHTTIQFHEVAEELEDLTLEVLVDHPAFPHIRKDYPEMKKQEHVKVVATHGQYQPLMTSKNHLT